MNKLSFAILILLLLSSCSKELLPKSHEIKNIEAAFLKQNFKQNNVRILANENPAQCLTDDLTEDRILSDIRKLEIEKNPMKGIINGIDLSRLPPSQAKFIDKNKAWIHTTNLDFSDCSDIKCIFNKIYPNPTGLEGHLIYYFYLKMGYILSTENKISGLSFPDTITYKDTLFSIEELRSFYLLSNSLGSSFQKLPTLTSLHRMPRNMTHPTYPTACGLAQGNVDSGNIILMDKCLTTDSAGPVSGNFYPLATHELSHRLDLALLKNFQAFSESKTWLDFSGWYLKEIVDTSTGAVTKRQWATKDSAPKDGFVRDYTSTSPAEDFADTIGFFRFDADKVKQISPQKFEWISKNLFGGKNFSGTGIGSYYSSIASQYTMNSLPEVINNCVSNKNFYQAYALSEAQVNDFSEYDPLLVQCILGGVSNITSQALVQIKLSEPEGCNYLSSSELVLKKQIVTDLANSIKTDLSKNIEISKQLQALSEFISLINESIDVRELFVNCLSEKDQIKCYQEKLNLSFQEIAKDYTDKIPSQVESYQSKYTQDNSFLATKGKLVSLFSQIFNGSESKFSDYANKKMQSCLNATYDLNSPGAENINYSPFNGGTQFINGNMINCINTKTQEDLLSILNKMGSKIGISLTTKESSQFVLEMYLNNFTSTIQALVKVEAEKENLILANLKRSINDSEINYLTSNTSWLGTIPKRGTEAMNACILFSTEHIDQTIKNQYTNVTSNLKFNSINKSTTNWAQEFCNSATTSKIVSDIFKKYQEKVVNDSIDSLHEIILKKAIPSGASCRGLFSRSDKVSLKARNLCLSAKWGSISDDAIAEWLSLEELSSISFARKRGTDYLSANKKEFLNEATLKMNGN